MLLGTCVPGALLGMLDASVGKCVGCGVYLGSWRPSVASLLLV